MQIVIDIPEDNFNRIRELAEVQGLSDNLMGYSLLAIAHGTVLPNGHGRLLDEKEVYKKFYSRCLAKEAKEVLEKTPTVIPADK